MKGKFQYYHMYLSFHLSPLMKVFSITKIRGFRHKNDENNKTQYK